MKKVIAALAATTVAATAHAGSLNLDMRFDYTNKVYNNKAKAAGKKGDSNFGMQTGRIDYSGKLSENLTFRTRLRFNEAVTKDDKNDNLGKHVDYAYVATKVGENTKMTLGKFNSDIGATEGMTSGADLYMKSMAYEGAKALNTDANAIGYSDYIYVTGVKLTQKMGDHEVSVAGFNPITADQVGTTGEGNSRFGAGVTAKGGFMDKALTYSAAYHSVANTGDAKKDFMAVGVVYNAMMMKFGLDYAANTYTEASKDKHVTSSVVGTFAYTGIENMTPMLKLVQNEFKPDTDDKITGTGVSGVLEYAPSKEEPFRYHIAYNNFSEKLGSASAKTLNEMVAGIRINADFLK